MFQGRTLKGCGFQEKNDPITIPLGVVGECGRPKVVRGKGARGVPDSWSGCRV